VPALDKRANGSISFALLSSSAFAAPCANGAYTGTGAESPRDNLLNAARKPTRVCYTILCRRPAELTEQLCRRLEICGIETFAEAGVSHTEEFTTFVSPPAGLQKPAIR